jgi:hypothetical protein
MAVSSNEARTMDPNDGPVERVRAAWMICVEVGDGGGRSGLSCFVRLSMRVDVRGKLTLQSTMLQ